MRRLVFLGVILLLLVSSVFASIDKDTLQRIDKENLQSIVFIQGDITFYNKDTSAIVEHIGWSGSGWIKDCKQDKNGTYRVEVGTAWHVLDANMFYDYVFYGKVKNWSDPYSITISVVYPDNDVVTLKGSQIEGYYLFKPDFGYLVYTSKTPKKPVKINSDFKAVRGDTLVGITCPYGISYVLSEGIIGLSDVKVLIEEHGVYRDFILAHTPLAPGSSGGAVFNVQGELIGFCDAGIQQEGASLSLIVPMSILNGNPKYMKVPITLKNHMGKPKSMKFKLHGLEFEYLPYVYSRKYDA